MPIVKTIERIRARVGTGRREAPFDASIRYAATVANTDRDLIETSRAIGFGDALSYAASRSEDAADDRGERIEHVFLEGVTSLETAAIELRALAALRPRVFDPVAHIVLSYDTARGENPTREEMQRDVEIVLRERGFTDAEDRRHGSTVERFVAGRSGAITPYVAVVHGDTGHRHIHIITSRVAVNGAVNDDFRSRVANEHAAAAIARRHGWEIVAGKFNAALVARQARERGANEIEVAALERRDAPTLSRLREKMTEPATDRSRRRGFVAAHAETVREAFARAHTYAEFVSTCAAVGIVVKLKIDRGKDGRDFFKVAFAEGLEASASGDSGTAVGVTAKNLREKFGDASLRERLSSSAEPSVPIEKPRSSDTRETRMPHLTRLVELAAEATRVSTAFQRELNQLDRGGASSASLFGIDDGDRRQREDHRRRLARRAQSADVRASMLDRARERLDRRVRALDGRIAVFATGHPRRARLIDERIALDARAAYEVRKDRARRWMRTRAALKREIMYILHRAYVALRRVRIEAAGERMRKSKPPGLRGEAARAFRRDIRAWERAEKLQLAVEAKQSWARKSQSLKNEERRASKYPSFDVWLVREARRHPDDPALAAALRIAAPVVADTKSPIVVPSVVEIELPQAFVEGPPSNAHVPPAPRRSVLAPKIEKPVTFIEKSPAVVEAMPPIVEPLPLFERKPQVPRVSVLTKASPPPSADKPLPRSTDDRVPDVVEKPLVFVEVPREEPVESGPSIAELIARRAREIAKAASVEATRQPSPTRRAHSRRKIQRNDATKSRFD